MYGEGPIANAVYEAGTPFLSAAPHFDRDYQFRQKASFTRHESLLDTEVIGGPRLRMFYPEFRDAPPWKRTAWRAMRKLRQPPVGAAAGVQTINYGFSIAPDLTKIPLIKARPGLSWTSNHRCTPLRLSDIRGALLHFKFFADFHHRARSEAARGQHWDGGAEYVRYAALVDKDPGVSLFFTGSETFRSTQQLVDLNLIKSCVELDWLAGGRANMQRERCLRGYTSAVTTLGSACENSAPVRNAP
jgi:hypothetical protein